MDNIKVSIIGAYPPPYGGNSVHIARLAKLLRLNNYDIKVFDFYSKYSNKNVVINGIYIYRYTRIKLARYIFLTMKLLLNRSSIYHFHISSFNKLYYIYLIIYLISKYQKKIIITIHSGSFFKKFSESDTIRKKIIINILDKVNKIVCVGQQQQDVLLKNNICKNKIQVIPAFLPPLIENSEEIDKAINRIGGKSSILILMSGFAKEYYGYHIVYDAVLNLRNEGFNIGLIMSFYSEYDEIYLNELNKIASNDNMTVFFRDLSSDEFSYLLSKIDIYVRATDRDGDAVAIREAAYFDKKVVASDCVKRPDGCIVFKTMDTNDLKEAIVTAISQENSGKIREKLDYSKIITLYNKLNSD